MYGRLKGQFFILGALLLCVLFFAGLPAMLSPGAAETGDLSSLSENLGTEMPRAVNLAMHEDGNPGKLASFSDFIRSGTADRYLGIELLWVVTYPDRDNPGDVVVTAGNWLGRPVRLTAVIGGTPEDFDLDDRETSDSAFTGLGNKFDVSLSFENRAWTATLARDKTNLYCFLRLSRGDDALVSEFSG